MSRQVAHFYKDTDEAVSYTLNWSDDLNGSTISSVTWVVPSGLTSEATSNTTTTATNRLAGGTPGRTYTVTCTVTTAAAEDLQAHVLLTVGN